MSQYANLTAQAANVMANAQAAECNSGLIKIYSGPQPATGDTALSGNTLLATLAFGATAFGASSGGVITANAITPGTAVANGTATFARLFESDGATAIMDVQLGVTGAAINLNSTNIQSGNPVSVTSCTLGIPLTPGPIG